MNATVNPRKGMQKDIGSTVNAIDSIIERIVKNKVTLLLVLMALFIGIAMGAYFQSEFIQPEKTDTPVILTKEQFLLQPFREGNAHALACRSDLCALELDARNVDGFIGFESKELGNMAYSYTGMTLYGYIKEKDVIITAKAKNGDKIISEEYKITFG